MTMLCRSGSIVRVENSEQVYAICALNSYEGQVPEDIETTIVSFYFTDIKFANIETADKECHCMFICYLYMLSSTLYFTCSNVLFCNINVDREKVPIKW